ncbi:cyclic lactone autoinducer peptide [Alkaliphilus peptidifermentans]|uniref:Cyclic lactone autoinducer peptide n=1 Tax=Alkaliphilus peptidifermentans DSM 18978 TaxID=1120976 RepID=A0A1G5KRN7_9FIRM|nr:cyclic lactone autoinducer peptide [Alkaliphilus peptidifermentans]SCZ03313.1 cyclic lactone autoinducer peptide [Alkaliphilus peptidifermentans DSM 18978]
MKKRLLQAAITLLTFLALSNIASATSVMGYQPEIPQELLD